MKRVGLRDIPHDCGKAPKSCAGNRQPAQATLLMKEGGPGRSKNPAPIRPSGKNPAFGRPLILK